MERDGDCLYEKTPWYPGKRPPGPDRQSGTENGGLLGSNMSKGSRKGRASKENGAGSRGRTPGSGRPTITEPRESAAAVVDITSLGQAEQALRESEHRLKRAQKIAHLGSWELDLANNRLTWSDEVYRIFGLEPQEFGATYEAFLEAVHPDDRAAVDAAYSASLRENRDTYEIEHRVLRRATGEVRFVHEKCEHFRDDSGRIIRSLGMVHDITDRKRLEEALQTQAEQYFTIVDTTPDGFWLVDDQARLVDVNDLYCRMSGYSRQELLTLGVSDLEAVEEADETVQHMCKIMESGSDRFETRHRAKDGRLFDVEISTTFLVSKGWFIVFIRDITERKRAEEALRESEEALRQINEQLEERVRERTAELRALMEDLEKSRDDLRKLASKLVLAEEQERKRISAVLHDEVAQTLAAARTRLELLRNMPGSEDCGRAVSEAYELIGQSIRETRALMRDITSPALYEMGLRSAVETLAGEVTARHGLAVACSFEGSPWSLDPDLRVMLFQVVKELVQNVVKHSRARNAAIRIVDGKDAIRVVVADNGQGFDLRSLGSPGFEGGFGLFSIRERVRFFEGDVAIESNPGAGTAVTVVLPKVAADQGPATEASEREPGNPGPAC
jgi:PAS domain S-box-containing protein